MIVRCILLLLLVFSGCAGSGHMKILSNTARSLNLESFDYIWSTIKEKHFDPDFGGLDWNMVRDTLRPKMMKVKTMQESRRIMNRMIDVLNLSHFNIIPAEVYTMMRQPADIGTWGGVTGMDVRILGDRVFVISVEEEAPANRAGVKRGWEVIRIGESDIATMLPTIIESYEGNRWREYIVTSAVFNRLSGSIGDTLVLVFQDLQEREIMKKIILEEQRGAKVQIGYMPPFYAWIEHTLLEDSIGYIAFNGFIDPIRIMPAFNEAVTKYMDARGIIIDLRGNPGGMLEMGMGMAGWFVEKKAQYLGTMSTRDTELKLIVRPRPRTYTGPLAILVDGLSASCSEVFSGGLKDLKRARIFGKRTVGAALPSLIEKLPNGDGFQYVFAHYKSFKGRVLEGSGVEPDVEVDWSLESLSRGEDPALQAAVEWIRTQ